MSTRSRRSLRVQASPAIVAAVVSFVVPASAQVAAPAADVSVTKDQCIDADTHAQSLRRDGKVDAARAQLRTCIDPACPKLVRDDCTQRLDELERVAPSIAFDAKDGAGRDLTAVKVTVDGRPFADKLDGSSLAIDPGEHDFAFEIPGEPLVTKHLVLHEGEKGRREAIVLGSSYPMPMTSGEALPVSLRLAPVEERPGSASRETQQVVALATGSVGVIGIGVGIVFGLIASSDFSTQKQDCPTEGCSSTNHALAVTAHQKATTAGTIATTAFIAGGALFAGAVALLLTAPKDGARGSRAAVELVPGFGAGGVEAILRGSF